MRFSHILVTTDFSDISKKAFDYAAYQAKMENSKVTLINILEEFQLPPELQRVLWDPARLRQMESDYVTAAKEQLESFGKEYFHNQEVTTASIVAKRSPAKEICNYANEHKCDLIVIGGHGRGAAGRLLLGSTVQNVLAQASCPVLVITK